MSNYVLSLIATVVAAVSAKFARKPCIDNIVAGFEKTVEQLEAASVEHALQSMHHANEAVKHSELADLHADEEDRAARIADKIRALID